MSRLVASGLGAGFSPWAPGTAGSAVAVVVGAALMTMSGWALPVAAVAACAGGFWAVPRAVRDPGEDPGWVVIDEVAGQWIAMCALPAPHWPGLLAAFALFRLFDIWKPGPVGWADRQGGAFGIMTDDILAGLAAALVLGCARWAGLIL